MIVGAETGESESIRARATPGECDRRTDGQSDAVLLYTDASLSLSLSPSFSAYEHRVTISSINRPLWHAARVKTPVEI